MDSYGTCYPEVGVTDFAAIAELIRSLAIDLLVVGPEVPLVRGIVDYLRLKEGLTDLLIVGPDQVGAQLEGEQGVQQGLHGASCYTDRSLPSL